MNQIRMVRPYRKDGFWVFDDEAHGLVAEPFILGASQMIDRHLASRGIKQSKARGGFTLLFSHEPFPGADVAELDVPTTELEEQAGGRWYWHHGEIAWLCPALFFYFDEAPAKLYFNAELV